MKKIMKLALFFTAIAAGNLSYTINVKGLSSKVKNSKIATTLIHDDVSLTTTNSSDTSDSSSSGSSSTSSNSSNSSINSDSSSSSSTKPTMARFTSQIPSIPSIPAIPKSITNITGTDVTNAAVTAVTTNTPAAVSKVTQVVNSNLGTSATAKIAVPAAPIAPAATAKVQGLIGSAAATYAPIQFTNSSGQTGNYWKNALGHRLGNASINGQNYTAVVVKYKSNPAISGSIGPVYTWAYNRKQQAAITSMGLDIKNAVSIGDLSSSAVKSRMSTQLAAAKTKLRDLNMSMVMDAAKETETRQLENQIEQLTDRMKNFHGVQLIGIPATQTSSNSTTSSTSSAKMMTLAKPVASSK